jgi:hypothetical protein
MNTIINTQSEIDMKRWADLEKLSDKSLKNFSVSTKMLFLERWLHNVDGNEHARIDRDEKDDFRDLLNQWHNLKQTVDPIVLKSKFDLTRHHFQNHLFSVIKKLPEGSDRKEFASRLKCVAQFSHPSSPPVLEMIKKIKSAFEPRVIRVPSSPTSSPLYAYNLSRTNALVDIEVLDLASSARLRFDF